jgi:DMSO/TMAO reductase YedYZ molybdopterin-dependent catalytic subunit
VLHVGEVPRFDPATWTLRVHGEVERPLVLGWEAFLALPQVDVQADFHCVTAWSVLDNRWTGVALAELALRVGVKPRARFARFADGGVYDTTVPLAVALDDDVLLAHARNGEPLAPEHGGPLRAIVPKRYAWKSCKWIREVEFLASERLGFWEVRGYHNGADPWREERLV